ncbi:Endoplasmic reticulum junction formation protein lunapark [Nymphon striatum]|nr:Endoplasmic reticulum junction formation protein lunapark [Nymphon striatum]
METETYKVAKDLLDKFDEKQNKPAENSEKLKKTAEDMELRKRTASARGLSPNQGGAPLTNGSSVLSAVPTPRSYVSSSMKSPALTRPILPKDRGVADRLVEYLIGDGPNARYALICRRCNSHNGMALQEEFEFLSFRCCYCQYPNPARKLRPNAPKLPESPHLVRKPSPESTNSDEAKSEADTEEEVMSDPEEQNKSSPDDKKDSPAVKEKEENETKDLTEMSPIS